MMTDLPSLLTASSILLGVLTALYGLFYSDIKSVIEITPKRHIEDNKQEYDRSKRIFSSKYIPLMIGAFTISLIFLPELYKQIRGSINAIINFGFINTYYDTLIASFIAVCCFMILIAVIMIRTGFQLNNKITKLNPKQKNTT